MPNDPMKYEVRNPQIEQVLRDIGHSIGDQLPAGFGFTLLLFSYDNKDMFYISNAEREGIIAAMREFIEKFGAN